MMKIKQIVYTISAKLYFSIEESIEIGEYLKKLREVGTVEVIDVIIVEKEL